MSSSEIDEKILALKEELLREIKESESRATSLNKNLEGDLADKINQILSSYEEFKVRMADLQNFNATVQVKVLDNMGEIQQFKVNTSEDLFSHNIQINNLEKNIKTLVDKFDRMTIENLLIPGKIGEYCQYKNLREYIEVNFI